MFKDKTKMEFKSRIPFYDFAIKCNPKFLSNIFEHLKFRKYQVINFIVHDEYLDHLWQISHKLKKKCRHLGIE